MNTGGRRRPLGPLLRGLSAIVFVVAVLGLALGAAAGHSPGDGHAMVPSLSHSVAVAHVAVRSEAPGTEVIPAGLTVLTAALTGVLIRTRRRATRPVRVRSERRQGRAPPGGFPR